VQGASQVLFPVAPPLLARSAAPNKYRISTEFHRTSIKLNNVHLVSSSFCNICLSVCLTITYEILDPELDMGRIDPRVGSGQKK